MKGLLTKDFLTIKKKYGLPRVIMDIAIIIALMFILEKSGTIYISFLLIPIEIMSMIISLTTCDEQWKWGKYTVFAVVAACCVPVSHADVLTRSAFRAVCAVL